MDQRSNPLMGDGTELDDEAFDSLQREVAEEAMTIHRALAETGGWRSAQDCWVEARTIVLARRRT